MISSTNTPITTTNNNVIIIINIIRNNSNDNVAATVPKTPTINPCPTTQSQVPVVTYKGESNTAIYFFFREI